KFQSARLSSRCPCDRSCQSMDYQTTRIPVLVELGFINDLHRMLGCALRIKLQSSDSDTSSRKGIVNLADPPSSIHDRQIRPSDRSRQPRPVGGEFQKSRSDGCLIESATVLLPLVRSKV